MTAPLHMHGAESLHHRGLPTRSRSRRDVTPPLTASCIYNTRLQRPCWPWRIMETRDKTLVCSKMADGSSEEDRPGPEKINDITFSALDKRLGDTKKCSDETLNDDSVKLSFYKELKTSESCEKSDTRGVAANPTTVDKTYSQKSSGENIVHGDDRKKRCFDRYDSSESSDSGVAVLSPTESSGYSGSDITEPRSPRSPESSCSGSEESGAARMPPWASEPAPPPRRPAPTPAPGPARHRRITEYFNHKMKPQNGLKRETTVNDDTKKKCLPKNGVTHDLEKYISYLSQTLSPKVLMDVGKQTDNTSRQSAIGTNVNGIVDSTKKTDLNKMSPNTKLNGMTGFRKPSDKNEKTHANLNGFLDVRHNGSFTKEKQSGGLSKVPVDGKKKDLDIKTSTDPSANGIVNKSSQIMKRKLPITASSDLIGLRIAPATSASQSPKKMTKLDASMNGVVSSTTTLDSRMNGVTCGSNNLNLNPIIKSSPAKKEILKKPVQHTKKTNRKSSACIANSKNLTWSKANNLKQVQLQKLNCSNSPQSSPMKPGAPVETNSVPKMNIQNGVRHVSMAVNSSLSNVNVPATNFQNCHQINISQQCNGSIQANNLASFVAVPQNVMLTTLRIPQTGQTFNGANISAQQNNINNMTAFNRPNVNVSSPTKLNGQFVFPLVQNINGTVVQIPNLVAKMPNFVLPQTSQLSSPRHDHLQNQQGASILINGTLLKLANTVASPYTNVNKPAPASSQSIPVMNKNISGMPTVGMTVQSKPNYVNFSHPVLVPQSGFIVTSVPNLSVKETWSCLNTPSAPSSQTTCSNPIVHHPSPIVANFTAQALHTSSIPIAPVKPPDNPIQGTEPPSSTVKEPECCEVTPAKYDVPWLSKTVNNNILTLESNKMSKKGNTRPFAHVSSLADKLEELAAEKTREKYKCDEVVKKIEERLESCSELREVEKVTRREETIFTQITVLKDVSSDVHNAVIETNFCCTTTESESGIGTDKSIDSPSDSQISKECDEDSSLSLSVSICSADVPCQKSPILKQPKTLRFPPRSLTKPNSDKRTSSTDTTSTVTVCLWENCKMEFDGDPDLLEHLQNAHVEPQAGKENYVCLWEQCKVRGKPSCSRLWLERHTQSHGGNKPFKCIVDCCDRRFSTQTLLERHVNNHFNEASPSGGSNKKTTDSAAKLIRRNGKKLRYRRQPWSARMFDFFDAGMMEGLAWRLTRVTRWRLAGACPLREVRARHTLTLRASLTATRYNTTARRREALITYYPPHVLEDEWVPEKEVTRFKRVDMSSLSASTKVLLYSQFCASYRCVIPSNTTNNTPVKRPEPRRCTSSRILSSLLSKRRRTEPECRTEPLPYCEDSTSPEVSGAKKRKLGRRYGGNSFWPCGR